MIIVTVTGRTTLTGRCIRAQDHGVILPLYHQMTDADQDCVIAALRAICA